MRIELSLKNWLEQILAAQGALNDAEDKTATFIRQTRRLLKLMQIHGFCSGLSIRSPDYRWRKNTLKFKRKWGENAKRVVVLESRDATEDTSHTFVLFPDGFLVAPYAPNITASYPWDLAIRYVAEILQTHAFDPPDDFSI